MNVKLLTEHHLEFVSLIGGCTCSSESTLVKMPHLWKSHVTAQLHLYRKVITYNVLYNMTKVTQRAETMSVINIQVISSSHN